MRNENLGLKFKKWLHIAHAHIGPLFIANLWKDITIFSKKRYQVILILNDIGLFTKKVIIISNIQIIFIYILFFLTLT